MAKPIFAILGLAALTCACQRQAGYPEPPRTDSRPRFEARNSTLTVPVTLSLDELQRSLERSTPKRLWAIDEKRRKCIGGQKVKAFGRKVKITPDLGCRIVGEVTRGPLRLSGKGERLSIRMPVYATISARDVGGIIKQETATGSANVNLNARLRVDRQWNPHAKVEISYSWTEPPGIDFLGQRIRFVSRADKELAKVVSKLEHDLEKDVSRVELRPTLEGAWRQAFAVINLSREKPAAWMRVTPTAISFNGYSVNGRSIDLTASLEATTETFVGDTPPPLPKATALPPQHALNDAPGFNIFIPVIADYAQLEPVLLRALRKLAKKGIRLEDIGQVKAEFDKVTIHATSNNRLAVGIDARVRPVDDYVGIDWGEAKGRIWLTAEPYHDPDSELIRIRDLAVFGDMDRLSGDLLVRLMASDQIRLKIETGVKEDFASDYAKVLASARKAIAERREGDFLITAGIDDVHHGLLQVTGAGLFLPVEASGSARIVYRSH